MPNFSDLQTDCLKVVTIGYLKSFIGDEVQNSSNGSSIYVNYSDNTYCPTYAELTRGTFIQNWQQGSTPNGDRDGIVVNATCTGTGSAYASNQLVNQKDLSMKYTRFKTFTIGHTGSPVDECGGNVSISYTHQYTRYNKSMANDCTVSTTSATASDTANNEVSFSAGCGWVHPQVGTSSVDAQPSNRTAAARSCTITGSISFRGTSHSDTTSVSQDALTGSYSNYEGRHYTSVTARATTSTSFTGCGSHDFGASATGYYYDRYEWKDSCGHVYHSSPYDDINGSESAGSKTGSFSKVDCPTTSCDETKSLSFSYHGYSDSVSFSRTGNNSCETTYTYGEVTTSRTADCAGGSVTVSTDSMPYTATTGGASSTGVTSATLTVSVSECTNSSGCTTSSSGTASPGGTIHYTITQTGCSSACDCSKLTVEGGTSGPDAGNVKLAYYSGDCLTNVSASVSESWITNTGFTSDKVLTGTVTSNGSTSSNRTATITITATECSGKTVTFTQEKAIDWSEKVCNFHVCLGDPEVQYEIRKDGSHSITSIGNWYAKYSAGTFSYEIVYEEPCTTGWVTFSQLSGTDADKVWNEIYAYEGSLANNALKHVFPGWVRGWLPAWRNGWLVPINITGTANNTGIERHAKVYLKMNGVTCCYFPVVQESNTVECPAMANVVTQMPIMQGVTADGGTITQGIKFYTGNTSFHSVGSITGLSNLTSVSWGSDAESGWKWLNIVVPANSSDSSRTCSFTINATVGDGGCKECTYDVSFTQLGRTASCDCSKLTVNGTIE